MKRWTIVSKKICAMALACTMTAVLFVANPITVSAAEPEFILKIANSNAPFTNINGQQVMDAINAGCFAFKNYVEQSSGGKIEVEIYDSGVLGGSAEGLSQCMQNVVQACVTGDGELATLYPNLQVLSVPYLFETRTEFYNMLDSKWSEAMFADLNNTLGVRLMASSDNGGFRSISNNKREIKTAADLEGVKIRCMEIPAYVTMLESMGATATPIAWAELYTSLQTGVVDGQENAPTTIMNGSLHEVQKYYTLDQHSISSLVLMINDDFYTSLPAELQGVVTEAGHIAQAAMRGANCANEELALQGLADGGLNVYIPNPEEKLTFKDASQEPVVQWLKTQLSEDYVDGFMTAVDDVKAGMEEAADSQVVVPSTQPEAASPMNPLTIGAIAVAIISILGAAFVVSKSKKQTKGEK